MTTASPWDQTRWRAEQPRGHCDAHSQASQLNAPTVHLDPYTYAWNGLSRADVDGQSAQARRPTESYTDASTFHSRPSERHSSPATGNYGPHQLTDNSPHRHFPGSWRGSLPLDHTRTNDKLVTDAAPLTLHIPNKTTQELPRISPVYSTQAAESQSYSGSSSAQSHQQRSLPSFATFQEHTSRSDDPDEVEIAPMSSRLSCYSCTKLKPMVREVAVAVAELDENLQHFCNKSVTRTIDFPQDSPVRAVQWILDRLRFAKDDLQEAARRNSTNFLYQQSSNTFSGIPPRIESPPNPLKRSADRWDREDLSAPKRPRSGASPDESRRASVFKDDRRTSVDFALRDQSIRPGYSPPLTESLPNSAYPRHSSPLSARPIRTLPSPSSVAYPPSAAPSLAPPTADSPGTSYQPTLSIHTTSTNSATSQHIADLQHQITVKSLAHQTLQAEYASLLQKLQRERVRSQTIEKKTNVADQEVNELTGKNEDLTDQIKNLQAQLEESEKKREVERSEVAKEKEQWGRMLEMSGRLHAKLSEDKQKLVDEKTALGQRLIDYEDETAHRYEQFKKDFTSHGELPRQGMDEVDQRRISQGSELVVASAAPTRGQTGDSSNDVVNLKREIIFLNGRVDVLRFALEETRRQNLDLDERARGLLQKSSNIGSAIDQALKGEGSSSHDEKPVTLQYQKTGSGSSTTARRSLKGSPSQTAVSQTAPVSTPSCSSITMNEINSMVPHGPAGFGLHNPASNSSPERLINALGPVPAPLPPVQQHGSGSFVRHSDTKNYDRSRSHPERRLSSGDANPWMMPSLPFDGVEDGKAHGSSFRPITHHVPSPYSNSARNAAHADASPRSYHSSPGPILDDSASSYSGSAAGQSPRTAPGAHTDPSGVKEERRPSSTALEPRAFGAFDQTRRNAALHTATDTGSATAMPPPPRPTQSQYPGQSA